MLELKIRLDWSEMDMFQHINNVSYFKFAQANRINILEKVGLQKSFSETGVGPTLAHTECDFKKELNYPGNVIIKSTIKEIKNTSFIIQHQFYNDHNELCAQASDVIVVYDYLNEIKHPIPEAIRAELSQILLS
ncbi:MAG: acyl-CoA thioesterase [Flavobacteriales bacterium]|nr:acyl-CoA thioesterase [Flavobacteriales bacterium]MCB9195737.1 acyl-CoA thioesterase [Flavobacteriales bacterium]